MSHHRLLSPTLTFSSSVVRLVRESEGSKKNTQYHNNKPFTFNVCTHKLVLIILWSQVVDHKFTCAIANLVQSRG